MEKDYLKKLELKSILKMKNTIEKIAIIKNKYLLVESFNEIAIYLINTNKLKFKIPLKEEKIIDEPIYRNSKIFNYNFKLRIINYEKKTNSFKLITDKYLIEADFDKKKWKIINKLKRSLSF